MRVTGSRVYARPAPVPKMPPGLELLMEGLTRQVLKESPVDIHEYCANHMHKLLQIRDGPVAKRNLTLEEKVLRAQERVRQRTKERWECYDQLLQADERKLATKSEEDYRTMKTQYVLHDDQVPHNIANSSDLESILIESTHFNERDKENINSSEMLIIDHEGNGRNKEELNETSLNIIKINEDVQSPLLNENSVKAISKTPDNLVETMEITKEILKLNEAEHNCIGSANVGNECESITEEKLNNNSNEIDNEKEVMKSNMQHNLYVDVENRPVIARTNISQNTELYTNFESNTQSPIVQNDDSMTEKSNEISDSSNKTDADDKSSFQLECITDFEKEHVLSDTENKTTLNVDQSKPLDKDIMEYPKIDNSKQVIENSDPKVVKSLSSIETLYNTMEINDNMIDINTIHESSGMVYNECQSKKDNVQILIVEDSQTELQKRLEPSGEGLVENNVNVMEVTNICDTIKNDESVKQNIHESSNMNLETAAITIQKVFRNFLFKSRASTYEEEANDDCNTLDEISGPKEDSQYSLIYANLGKERRPLGNMRMDTVLQTVNEEKSLSQSTDDSSTLSSAATVIQAHVRGFLVRNKLGSHKTSANSLFKSNSPLSPSIENDVELQKSKTPLNIHIVPETNNFVSKDESTVVSMDLSLDGSPPTSINLHPLGYDKSERRKLKREDAIQSFSPPSNNSGKLSEDVDSLRENANIDNSTVDSTNKIKDLGKDCIETEVPEIALRDAVPDEVLSETNNDNESTSSQMNTVINNAKRQDSLCSNSDETDVVTPFSITPASTPTLSHTGEFHDVVLPTKVSRGDASVVRGE